MLQVRISQTKEDPDRGSSQISPERRVIKFGWKFGWTQSCPKLWVFLTPAPQKKWRIWRFLTARQTKKKFPTFSLISAFHPHPTNPIAWVQVAWPNPLGTVFFDNAEFKKDPRDPEKPKTSKTTYMASMEFEGFNECNLNVKSPWVQHRCPKTRKYKDEFKV